MAITCEVEREPEYVAHRVLHDGRHAGVIAQITNAKLYAGPPCEQGGYEEAW